MKQKEVSLFLKEAGLNELDYRDLVGVRTRRKTPAPPPEDKPKTEVRKKVTKGELYAPPEIRKLIKLECLPKQEFLQRVRQLQGIQEGEMDSVYTDQSFYEIYKEVSEEGGVIQVSSINNFTPIALKHLNLKEAPVELIQSLRRILFSLQYTERNPEEEKKIYELGLINFVDKTALRDNIHDKKFGLTYFNYDLTLFQEGAQGLDFDPEIFCLSHMSDHYRDETIDIRIQNPLDYGFKPSKLKNKKYKMTLGEYRFYQENYLDPNKMKGFKHIECLGKGQIFFGVNFEPSDLMLNTEVKKKVGGTFLDFHGDFDMMSYLDTDVPGCSLPQMYFKAPGCWTGGHQENISMSALNINHGPDSSEWFTLDLKYVDSLRANLKKNFGIDLYESEGLWYEGLDWFISRGYPVKRFLQRKDDIVVTGPGTLHWVRSYGVALQTSWNIMPKNYEQFEAAFARHKENKKIKFERADTIPLKSLILKYLNHERKTMSPDILRLCTNQLSAWLDQEQNILSLIDEKVGMKTKSYLKDLESFCQLCKQQVLVYFAAAPKNQVGMQCLSCFKENSKRSSKAATIYFKHEYSDVATLITACSNPRMNRHLDEIESLCAGVHVGEIGPCSKKSKARASSQAGISSIEMDKIERAALYEPGNEHLYELYEKVKSLDKYFSAMLENRENMRMSEEKAKLVMVSQETQTENTDKQEEAKKDQDEEVERSREKGHRQKSESIHRNSKDRRSASPVFSNDEDEIPKKTYTPYESSYQDDSHRNRDRDQRYGRNQRNERDNQYSRNEGNYHDRDGESNYRGRSNNRGNDRGGGYRGYDRGERDNNRDGQDSSSYRGRGNYRGNDDRDNFRQNDTDRGNGRDGYQGNDRNGNGRDNYYGNERNNYRGNDRDDRGYDRGDRGFDRGDRGYDRGDGGYDRGNSRGGYRGRGRDENGGWGRKMHHNDDRNENNDSDRGTGSYNRGRNNFDSRNNYDNDGGSNYGRNRGGRGRGRRFDQGQSFNDRESKEEWRDKREGREEPDDQQDGGNKEGGQAVADDMDY